VLMHYTVVIGTRYYITTIQLADLLLNPGQWRSGRTSRKSLIGLVASVAISICITLAVVALLSQRRIAEKKARNSQQRILLAVFLLDKNGDVLADADGSIPMVEIADDLPSSLDLFMSPRLPQFSPSAVSGKEPTKRPAKRRVNAVFRRLFALLSNGGLPSPEQGTAADLHELGTDQAIFSKCLRKTWDWKQPSESNKPTSESRASKERENRQLSKLRFSEKATEPNFGIESSKVRVTSTNSPDQKKPNAAHRRLRKNLEDFYLPMDTPNRKVSPAREVEELTRYQSKRETGEEKFERLFDRAASELSRLLLGSEDSEAKARMGVLYDRIVPVGYVKAGGSGALARGQMLVIAKRISTMAERESLLRSGAGANGFAFVEAATVAKRAIGSKGLGLKADETGPLVSDLVAFASQRTCLADQVTSGVVYVSLVAVQSLLVGGIQVAVDHNRRHSLPMVEIGDLTRPDGSESMQSLGSLAQLNSSLQSLSGHTLFSLIELNESLLERRALVSDRRGSVSSISMAKWIPRLLPSQKDQMETTESYSLTQERLINALVHNLIAFLDALLPVETVSYLLPRLTLIPEVIALLPPSHTSSNSKARSRNSAGSQQQPGISRDSGFGQAYSINFKVVVAADTDLAGLTWIPYRLFVVHNECRSKAPASTPNRYSSLMEGRRRSRAYSVDGFKIRSNSGNLIPRTSDVTNQPNVTTRSRASTLMYSPSASFTSLKDQVQSVKNKVRMTTRGQRTKRHGRSSSEPDAKSLYGCEVPLSHPSQHAMSTKTSATPHQHSASNSSDFKEGGLGSGLRRRSVVPLSPVLSQHEDAEGDESETPTIDNLMLGFQEETRKTESTSNVHFGSGFSQLPIRSTTTSSSNPGILFPSASLFSFTQPFNVNSKFDRPRNVEDSIAPDFIPTSESSISSRGNHFTPSTSRQSRIQTEISIPMQFPNSVNVPQVVLQTSTSTTSSSRFSTGASISEQRRQSAPSLIQSSTPIPLPSSNSNLSTFDPPYDPDWISKLLKKQLTEEDEAFKVGQQKEIEMDLNLLVD